MKKFLRSFTARTFAFMMAMVFAAATGNFFGNYFSRLPVASEFTFGYNSNQLEKEGYLHIVASHDVSHYEVPYVDADLINVTEPGNWSDGTTEIPEAAAYTILYNGNADSDYVSLRFKLTLSGPDPQKAAQNLMMITEIIGADDSWLGQVFNPSAWVYDAQSNSMVLSDYFGTFARGTGGTLKLFPASVAMEPIAGRYTITLDIMPEVGSLGLMAADDSVPEFTVAATTANDSSAENVVEDGKIDVEASNNANDYYAPTVTPPPFNEEPAKEITVHSTPTIPTQPTETVGGN